MRYVIATTEPKVFSKLNAWAREKKIVILEKGELTLNKRRKRD